MIDLRVRDVGESDFARQLESDGIGLKIGPFNAHIQVAVPSLAETLFQFYSAFPLLSDGDVYSFRVRIEPRRVFPDMHKRKVRFYVDGQVPHEDLPIEQAVPVLEWGMNLVIALRSHAYLMLHAAVVEKNGNAVMMPAAPGFGKTTLCTALVYRGWRLLSDEFGLVRPGDSAFIPLPRPMALKNESIDIIRRYAPDARIGPVIENTRKGTVAHVAPPAGSVERQDETVVVSKIVFPRWAVDAAVSLDAVPRPDGFMKLAMNAFNYGLLGEAGFVTVKGIVDRADCHQLVYSDLDDAVELINSLADNFENG